MRQKMNAKQTNSDENPLTLQQEGNFSVKGLIYTV